MTTPQKTPKGRNHTWRCPLDCSTDHGPWTDHDPTVRERNGEGSAFVAAVKVLDDEAAQTWEEPDPGAYLRSPYEEPLLAPDFPLLPDSARSALVDLGFTAGEADHGIGTWYDNEGDAAGGLVTAEAFEVIRTLLNDHRLPPFDEVPGFDDAELHREDIAAELPDPRGRFERGEMVLEAYAGKGWRSEPGTLARILTDLAAVAESLGPDAFANAYLTAHERTNR